MGVVSVLLFGVIYGYLIFITLGIVVGVLGFETFRKNEYYFYYNKGFTRLKLIKASFAINLIASIPLFLIVLAISILFGNASII
ncbi:MAG: hypothetical protein K0U54_11305 [Bacteroidetes bacterium]|nr:hypothetical protein [Bacteroidota bacterium]